MNERTQDIKSKGFDMQVGSTGEETYDPYRERINPLTYADIRVGSKTVKNALTDINFYKKVNPKATKENVLRAINNNNFQEMRNLSSFFARTSGIYMRLCRYMAYLYRYDWLVTPILISNTVKPDKVLEGFYKSLLYLDNFHAKQIFGEIALKVIQDGAYYGYKIPNGDKMVLQELPVQYCRSRFFSGGKPIVEFNMRFFEDTFPDTLQRVKIIRSFPDEFSKGYILYKEGKLPIDFAGDSQGWYTLNVANTVKFNVNGNDSPLLMSVIPAIIDLEEAKEIDRQKMKQQLLKVIIQQMPIDKDGELIFDVDEARALHNNVVAMLGNAIGVDVLTTFAKVDVADLADRSTTTSVDEIMKVERGVYNEAGISQMQFNTSGNLALEKSILNDEASMQGLIFQFQSFLNELLEPFNKNPKKLVYTVQILATTVYNYQALAKVYKEQMQVGFSKILPQVALGQSQSSILATAYFENEILDLNSLFIAPAMSSTTSGAPAGDVGRPKKPADQLSEKTIQNNESMA